MKFFVVLIFLAWICAAIAISIKGLILAFSASIILGLIALVIQPLPFVIGIIGIFGRSDLCEVVAQWLNLPM